MTLVFTVELITSFVDYLCVLSSSFLFILLDGFFYCSSADAIVMCSGVCIRVPPKSKTRREKNCQTNKLFEPIDNQIPHIVNK